MGVACGLPSSCCHLAKCSKPSGNGDLGLRGLRSTDPVRRCSSPFAYRSQHSALQLSLSLRCLQSAPSPLKSPKAQPATWA